MNLEPEPDSLTCAECGAVLAESGYLPASEVGDETYEPIPEAALCGACGFNEVGFAGCAPELDDVLGDSSTGDVLLQVKATDAGVDVLSVKD